MRFSKQGSTAKQIAAYRNICALRHEEHMRKTYGMLPIEARYIGKCGCGRIFGEGSGWAAGTPCRFDRGDQIVKFRGEGWWNLACVDRVRLDEARANARYVRERQRRDGSWVAIDWADDAKTAELWREDLEIEPNERERVTDRQEVGA